jgi:hypothetical protein
MNEFLISSSGKFFFMLLKHFNKKLLKKYFPLKEEDLQIKLGSLPNIYINEQINHCNISFPIGLKNYTNYDLFISFIEINMIINDYRFLKYEKIILKNFMNKEGTQFFIEIPITYYQVRKILHMISVGGNILNATFELKINAKNIFGDIIFDKRMWERIEVIYIPVE